MGSILVNRSPGGKAESVTLIPVLPRDWKLQIRSDRHQGYAEADDEA